MSQITMKALLEAGVHFGHQVRKWNPKMAKYIFGERNKIHIIDLQKTVRELKKVYKFVRDIAAKGEPILFVGTKKQAVEPIETEAKRCGAFYVSERWIGGTLTNFATIRRSVARLKELEKMKEEGIFKLLSKKERSKREKEMKKLEQALSGIKEMDRLPGLVFIVDPVEENVAVREARRMSIPIVAICDTDADPDFIDYVIPGNDDAVRSIKLFCSIIADAVLEGKESIDTKQEVSEQTEQYPETGISKEELEKEIELTEN
ncbi:MAG: 30S ribosomal protein S2 [Endomicrobiia bacterium]